MWMDLKSKTKKPRVGESDVLGVKVGVKRSTTTKQSATYWMAGGCWEAICRFAAAAAKWKRGVGKVTV